VTLMVTLMVTLGPVQRPYLGVTLFWGQRPYLGGALECHSVRLP